VLVDDCTVTVPGSQTTLEFVTVKVASPRLNQFAEVAGRLGRRGVHVARPPVLLPRCGVLSNDHANGGCERGEFPAGIAGPRR